MVLGLMWGLGFRVLGFRVNVGLGFRVLGLGLMWVGFRVNVGLGLCFFGGGLGLGSIWV